MNKTARQHCASRRSCCFSTSSDNSPRWRKCCGYIVIEENGYVYHDMIYAIEIHDNMPSLRAYKRKDITGPRADKNYSVNTLQKLLKNPENWESTTIDFTDLRDRVSCRYPGLYVPRMSQICVEYGIKYDKYTNTMTNFVGCVDDN